MSMYRGPLSTMIDSAVEKRMTALKNEDFKYAGSKSEKKGGVITNTEIFKGLVEETKKGETTRGKGPGYQRAWSELSDAKKKEFGTIDNFIREAEAWHDENTTPDETIQVEGQIEKQSQRANLHYPRKVELSKATRVQGDFGVIDPSTNEMVPWSSIARQGERNPDGLFVNADGKPYLLQPNAADIQQYMPRELPEGHGSGFGFSVAPSGGGRPFSYSRKGTYTGDFESKDAVVENSGINVNDLEAVIEAPYNITDDNKVQNTFISFSDFEEANPENIDEHGGLYLHADYRKLGEDDERELQGFGVQGRDSKSKFTLPINPDTGNFMKKDGTDFGFGMLGSFNVDETQGIQPFQMPNQKADVQGGEAPPPITVEKPKQVMQYDWDSMTDYQKEVAAQGWSNLPPSTDEEKKAAKDAYRQGKKDEAAQKIADEAAAEEAEKEAKRTKRKNKLKSLVGGKQEEELINLGTNDPEIEQEQAPTGFKMRSNNTRSKRPVSKMLQGRTMSFRKNKF